MGDLKRYSLVYGTGDTELELDPEGGWVGHGEALARIAALEAQVADLRRVGGQLSNAVHNLRQRAGVVRSESEGDGLRGLVKAWDRALTPEVTPDG